MMHFGLWISTEHVVVSEKILQFGTQYIHTWECHNETLCIAILNKQKCLHFKMEDRKVKQVLSGDWCQWKGGKYKERV
jgi:hypothetical protein